MSVWCIVGIVLAAIGALTILIPLVVAMFDGGDMFDVFLTVGGITIFIIAILLIVAGILLIVFLK